jgi:hypothetical protein
MFSIKNFEEGSASLNLYYLEVPAYAGYAFPIGNLSFYAQAGPYVGLKLGQSGDGGNIKIFNMGLGLIGGINIHKFKIELGYQQGLINIVEGGNDIIGSAFLGVSYVF